MRSLTPQLQQIVIDRGSLAECSNPSSALIARIRDARNAPQIAAHAQAMNIHPASPEEVEHFIAVSRVDERAANSFRSEQPIVQRLVLDRGTLSDCSNPSSALISRMKDARQRAPMM